MAKKEEIQDAKYTVTIEKNDRENKSIYICAYVINDATNDQDLGNVTMHKEIYTKKLASNSKLSLKEATRLVTDLGYCVTVSRLHERKDNGKLSKSLFDKETVHFQNIYHAIMQSTKSFDMSSMVSTLVSKEILKDKYKLEYAVDTAILDKYIDEFVAMESL